MGEIVNVALEKKISQDFTSTLENDRHCISRLKYLNHSGFSLAFYANDLEGWCFNLDSSQFTTCNTVKLCFMQIEQFTSTA